MDITRLLSGISGLSETRDIRMLELKVGQVVRGVLLKMLSDQEAMVGINGVPVRARLETPLNPGEATWLQVQPESSGAEIVLKPLAGSGTPIADRSLANMLKWLGLQNTEQNRQLIDWMHRLGLSIDRETVQAMRHSVDLKPAGADLGQWLSATAVALNKGIPVNGDAVRSLHAALFGKSPGELLQTLKQALSGWLANESARAGANPSIVQTAVRLTELLDRVVNLASDRLTNPPVASRGDQPLANRTSTPVPGARAEAGSERGATAAPANPGQTATGASPARTGQMTAAPARGHVPAQAQPASGLPAVPAASAEGVSPAPDRLSSNPAGVRTAEGGTVRTTDPGGLVQTGIREAGSASQTAGASGQSPAANEPAALAQSARPAETALPVREMPARTDGPVAPRPEPWLANLFRDLGFEHERQLLERLHLENRELPEALRDTVKGLVMALAGESQLPPALKEALQQTLHAITGQQLLMNADQRAPFSVVTLTVPLPGQDGGSESATVEIHARRNKGEPLDAANCRLLFDLNLARLGNLLMDVQVVDRMVSIRLLSDHPAAESLVNGSRKEAEVALAGIGYRLLSLLQAPYPKPSAEGKPESSADHPAVAGTGPAAAKFGQKPYRGVDLRI